MRNKSNISKSSALHFNSQQDALNFAGQQIKDVNDWLAFHNLNFTERYSKGDLAIVFKDFIATDNDEYELIVSSVPPQGNIRIVNSVGGRLLVPRHPTITGAGGPEVTTSGCRRHQRS